MTDVLPARERLSPEQFGLIAELARREAGLDISPSKNAMVFSRVSKHMKSLGFDNIDAYCWHLERSDGPGDLSNLIGALTTNVTDFFREPHHFETLEEKVAPQLFEAARRGQTIRIWSAGCSEGMEAYSIAMTLAEFSSDFHKLDFRILATDIDREMIARARQGVYLSARARRLQDPRYAKYVEPFDESGILDNGTKGRVRDHAAWVRMKDELRSNITFNTHNLIRDWPMQHRFDVIFCRNVVIYFDEQTQNTLWPKFAAAVQPNGWLFLGHSERLQEAQSLGLRPAGMTTYQKA